MGGRQCKNMVIKFKLRPFQFARFTMPSVACHQEAITLCEGTVRFVANISYPHDEKLDQFNCRGGSVLSLSLFVCHWRPSQTMI